MDPVYDGVISEIRQLDDGRAWEVRVRVGAVDAPDDPWVTIRKAELPTDIDAPKVGDLMTFTAPRLVKFMRVVGGQVLGGEARRTRG